MEITLIILIPLALWMISLYWLYSWSKFWMFFGINLMLFIAYMTWLGQSELTFLGHDEYGIRQMFLIAIILFGHVIAGFIFAIIKRRQLKL
jgi:hypothetical protein